MPRRRRVRCRPEGPRARRAASCASTSGRLRSRANRLPHLAAARGYTASSRSSNARQIASASSRSGRCGSSETSRRICSDVPRPDARSDAIGSRHGRLQRTMRRSPPRARFPRIGERLAASQGDTSEHQRRSRRQGDRKGCAVVVLRQQPAGSRRRQGSNAGAADLTSTSAATRSLDAGSADASGVAEAITRVDGHAGQSDRADPDASQAGGPLSKAPAPQPRR